MPDDRRRRGGRPGQRFPRLRGRREDGERPRPGGCARLQSRLGPDARAAADCAEGERGAGEEARDGEGAGEAAERGASALPVAPGEPGPQPEGTVARACRSWRASREFRASARRMARPMIRLIPAVATSQIRPMIRARTIGLPLRSARTQARAPPAGEFASESIPRRSVSVPLAGRCDGIGGKSRLATCRSSRCVSVRS